VAIDLVVRYKDPQREDGYFPFAFQRFARAYWWPLAERFGLERLQRLEFLEIRERDDAQGLIREILTVRRYVESAPADEVHPDHRDYLLERIDQVVPFLRRTIAEWDAVDYLSI
jgi:hypothetical protein